MATLGIVLMGAALSSCAPQTFATFSGVQGALPQAQCEILGKTRVDQHWIDSTIEAEVAGFGMKRPEPRAACAPPPQPSSHAARSTTTKRPSGGHILSAPAPLPGGYASPPVVTQPSQPPVPETVPAHKKTTLEKLREQTEQLNERLKRLEGK
jgi:hypothetical protein